MPFRAENPLDNDHTRSNINDYTCSNLFFFLAKIPMPENPTISEAEWVVMEAIWHIAPASAAQIIDELSDHTAWSHRTIRTMLNRLVDKNVLEKLVKTNRDGTTAYRPLVRRQDCIRREGRSFLERVFQGNAHSLLLHFAKEARLGPEKIAQLRRLLDEESP